MSSCSVSKCGPPPPFSPLLLIYFLPPPPPPPTHTHTPIYAVRHLMLWSSICQCVAVCKSPGFNVFFTLSLGTNTFVHTFPPFFLPFKSSLQVGTYVWIVNAVLWWFGSSVNCGSLVLICIVCCSYLVVICVVCCSSLVVICDVCCSSLVVNCVACCSSRVVICDVCCSYLVICVVYCSSIVVIFVAWCSYLVICDVYCSYLVICVIYCSWMKKEARSRGRWRRRRRRAASCSPGCTSWRTSWRISDPRTRSSRFRATGSQYVAMHSNNVQWAAGCQLATLKH